MSKNSRDVRTPDHKKRRKNYDKIDWTKKQSPCVTCHKEMFCTNSKLGEK